MLCSVLIISAGSHVPEIVSSVRFAGIDGVQTDFLASSKEEIQ
jgi:hypothetical protein